MRLLGKGILIVGAHPDDIEFGCLGTLLQLELQQEVYCYVMTTGRGNAARRIDETRAALDLPCVRRVTVGPFESAILQPNRESVREVSQQMGFISGLSSVLMPSSWDTHQDHRALAEIVLTAARRRAVNLLAYQGPSVTPDFPTNVYNALPQAVFEEKVRRLNLHESQVGHSYFSSQFLERWHWDKQAVQLGLPAVELVHAHRLVS
jgi:LmbE family N-acetylglucosaminyl deacetylase